MISTAMFLVLIAIILFLLYKYLDTENFINQPKKNVNFLSIQETQEFLDSDPDFYIANLSPTDLYARQSKTSSDYKTKAVSSAAEIPDPLKLKISKAVQAANKFFSKLQIKGIECSKINDIPWIIAYTSGNAYEDGLPHTRGGIIFLSDSVDETDQNLLRVLIHEKVHLYTRIYPEETSYYLESNGYIKWKQRTGQPRVRANPDLDNWIYIDPVSQKPMVAYYSSDKPYNISDVILSTPSAEHPYELLAYKIETLIKGI